MTRKSGPWIQLLIIILFSNLTCTVVILRNGLKFLMFRPFSNSFIILISILPVSCSYLYLLLFLLHLSKIHMISPSLIFLLHIPLHVTLQHPFHLFSLLVLLRSLSLHPFQTGFLLSILVKPISFRNLLNLQPGSLSVWLLD